MNANPKVFWKTYYHLIWRTKNSEPLLSREVKTHVLSYIRVKCQELECAVIALNAMEDHVHLLISIPPKWSVSEVIKRIKGGSSHHINHESSLTSGVEWQRGYGVLTISSSHIAKVQGYVERQEAHHQHQKLIASLERTEEEHENT